MGTVLTLDGVMQAPGGPNEDREGDFRHGGWLVPYLDEKLGEIMTEWTARAGAFLLGPNPPIRRTRSLRPSTPGRSSSRRGRLIGSPATIPTCSRATSPARLQSSRHRKRIQQTRITSA